VRASDVRSVRSVFCRELAEELFGDGRSVDLGRASAVFFSVRGAQPLADMLAGGDYDGDKFYVIQERELLELFLGQGGCGADAAAPLPAEAPSLEAAPRLASGAALEAALQQAFLSARHDASTAVGMAEVNHAAAVDKFGINHPISVELGEIYLQLLDGKGDGTKQAAKVRTLQAKIGPRPHWMLAHRGGDATRYLTQSTSALAQLATCSLGEARLALASAGLQLDPLLRLELHRSEEINEEKLQDMRKRMKGLWLDYKARFKSLKKQQQLEARERERPQPATGGGGGGVASDGRDDEREWQDKYFAMVAPLRETLLAPYEAQRGSRSTSEPPRLLAEACALYEVVYEEKQRAALGQEEPKYFTTFPWHVCGDMLLFVRKARVSRAINPSQALFSSLGTRGWE